MSDWAIFMYRCNHVNACRLSIVLRGVSAFTTVRINPVYYPFRGETGLPVRYDRLGRSGAIGLALWSLTGFQYHCVIDSLPVLSYRPSEEKRMESYGLKSGNFDKYHY